MPLTYAVEPATSRNGQQAWRLFEAYDGPPGVHGEILISETYTRQSDMDESIAVLLHELRSPLAAIQNAMAVLRLGSKDESFQQRVHEIIERQVRQLALLTSNFGRSPGCRLAKTQLQLARTDLCTVIRRAVDTVTSQLTERRQKLTADLPESNTWILGDASRLEQVFVNLLANASKYSETGGRIALSLHVCDGHALVGVRDSGIGIDADVLPDIFGLFVRADSMAVRKRSGLGIGLALVRSILSAHDGTVSATSAGVGQGSQFTVRLKLAI